MKQEKNNKYLGFIFIFFAILIRIAFAFFFKGHSESWNTESYIEFLLDGQLSIGGPPYLPTYHIFGYIFNFLVNSFGLFFAFWMKVGNILADIGILILLMKLAKLMFKSDRISMFICLAYAFNPISFQLTALHGQFDQYVFFFILLAAYIEMTNYWDSNHRTLASSLSLVLATFVKPYVIIFIPIFLFRRQSFEEKFKFALIYIVGVLLPLAVLFNWNWIHIAVKSMTGYDQAWHFGWGRPFCKYPTIKLFLDNFAVITKPIIIMLAFVFGYLGRKRNILLPILMIILVTYILSPTLGAQYLYWVIPIGVLFIDKFFCFYSVLGFIWHLNFFQNSVINANWYGNYHQFVPLTSLDFLYNFWLFPRWLNLLLLRGIGDIVIPILVIFWLISLLKRFNFKSSFSINTFKEIFSEIFKNNQSNAYQSSSRSHIVLLGILGLVAVSWILFTGIVFLRVDSAYSNISLRHYPKNIEYKDNKINQYFLHGRNQELVEKFYVEAQGSYYLRVETAELYKTYINGEFSAFNWAPDYGLQFGTNRIYKKINPLVDISCLVHPGKNDVQVVANFSFEEPKRNYIRVEIIDSSGNHLLDKREDLKLIAKKPFYVSLPGILCCISLFYLLFCRQKSIILKGDC